MPFKDLLFATFTYPDPTPERALRSGVALAARLGGTLTLLATRVDIPELHNRLETSGSIVAEEQASKGEATASSDDGSLGIGSLKGGNTL